MVTVIVKEMFDMTSKIPEVELSRAKAQLQSMLLMNLECEFLFLAQTSCAADLSPSPESPRQPVLWSSKTSLAKSCRAASDVRLSSLLTRSVE